MLSQGEQSNMVANHFAVQGECLGQPPRLALKPLVEQAGEGFGIHAREHLIEHTVARNLMKRLSGSLARQSQAASLRLVQRLSLIHISEPTRLLSISYAV